MPPLAGPGPGGHLPAAIEGSGGVDGPRPEPREPAAGGTVRDSEHRVRIADGELHLRVRGRGPRLLMLHGLTAHGGAWEPVVRRLERQFTLVVPDLLSRGRSEPRPDLSHGLARETARAREVARATGTAGAPVVGHSQGAALAAALAVGPGTPAGLVLVCPVTPWTRRPAVLEALRSPAVRRAAASLAVRLRRPVGRWVLRHRVFADPGRVDPATVERYAAPWARPLRARALLRVLADWRPRELAGRLPADPPPCRVLAGDRDRRVRPGEARRLARRLGADFERIEDAAHMVPVEAPGAVARAVESVSDVRREREV